MTSLLAKYISLLNEKGVNDKSFTEDEFKMLLRDHFADSVVFHQPRNKPELVYSSSFSLKDVVQDGEDCLEDKTQKEGWVIGWNKPINTGHGESDLPDSQDDQSRHQKMSRHFLVSP